MKFHLKRVFKKELVSACLLLFVSCGHGEYLSSGAIVVDTNGESAYTVLSGKKAVAVTNLETNLTTDIIEIKQNTNHLMLSLDGRYWDA